MIHAIILQKVQAILSKAAIKHNVKVQNTVLSISHDGRCSICVATIEEVKMLDEGSVKEMLEKYN